MEQITIHTKDSLNKDLQEAASNCNYSAPPANKSPSQHIFEIGAKSEEAKRYHQYGMYTDEDVKEIIRISRTQETFNFKSIGLKYTDEEVIEQFKKLRK